MSDYPHAELIAEFCNTLDERGRVGNPIDAIATSPQLCDWFASHGLIPSKVRVRETELGLAHDLRTGLRQLIDPLDPVAPASGRSRILQVAQCCPLAVGSTEAGRFHLLPTGDGGQGGLARLLIAILAAQQDGSLLRVKMCSAADCRWVFVDHSRPGTGRWCAMAACGNRAKKQAYRQRQRHEH